MGHCQQQERARVLYEGDALTFPKCDRKLARLLAVMEPGKDYTAAELACLTKSSRCEVGALLRSATADGQVKIVGVATTGWRSGTGFIYRVNENGKE